MTNFMAQMAEMVADMRRQMSQVLAGGTDISKLGNTTSTTKVVDGHIITVNETVVGGEDGVDLVHIRIIDVQPMESSMPTDANSGESGNKEGSKNGSEDDTQDGEKDAEALSSDEATGSPNRSENEIPIKSLKRQARSAPRPPVRGDMASDDDEDDVQQYQMAVFESDAQQTQVPVFDAQQEQSGRIRLLATSNNQVDVFDKPRPADLSRDTVVNKVLEQQHQRAGLIMVDPDAELMDVRDGKVVGVRAVRANRANDGANRRGRVLGAPRAAAAPQSW